MRHSGEPSVEEILESIKKVIARDNRDSQRMERPQRENPALAAAAPLPESHSPAKADDAVLDLAEAQEMEPVMEPVQAPATDGLTNESAARAMRDSLAALAMIAEPGVPPQIVRSGETSLEGLTRELLKPMLSRWLDENLPPIVERLVKAEIARIAGKKG